MKLNSPMTSLLKPAKPNQQLQEKKNNILLLSFKSKRKLNVFFFSLYITKLQLSPSFCSKTVKERGFFLLLQIEVKANVNLFFF